MRAVEDAGPYGGIDESTPVFGGAVTQAVGDAGPYGVYDRSHGGTTAGRRGRRPLRGASIWVRRKMRTGCGAKKVRSAVDRTRCAIGVGGGESRRCHSAGTK